MRRATGRLAVATILALAAGTLVAAAEPPSGLREAAHAALVSLRIEGNDLALLLDGSARAYAAPLARNRLSISQ